MQIVNFDILTEKVPDNVIQQLLYRIKNPKETNFVIKFRSAYEMIINYFDIDSKNAKKLFRAFIKKYSINFHEFLPQSKQDIKFVMNILYIEEEFPLSSLYKALADKGFSSIKDKNKIVKIANVLQEFDTEGKIPYHEKNQVSRFKEYADSVLQKNINNQENSVFKKIMTRFKSKTI